jgi:uncharacterized protein
VADVLYLDASAIVKTVVAERGSGALRRLLRRHGMHASSALSRVEVLRAVRRADPTAVPRAQEALRRIVTIAMTDELLANAGTLDPPELRSLDAIHLASARALASDLVAVVTYDERMISVATALGLPVVAPT